MRLVCLQTLLPVLCRTTVNDMLAQANLGQFFQAFVTAEDGMDTISQRFLSASIKLGRPPNQCVAFESSPAGITAAHNCTMKVRYNLNASWGSCSCKLEDRLSCESAAVQLSVCLPVNKVQQGAARDSVDHKSGC